jgi:hypothetical protein
MTIQVELSPEAEARLATIAAQRGIAMQEYAGELLDSVLASGAAQNTLTVDEFHAMLSELRTGSEVLPKLPTSAFSRESIYEDHP